jgi:hypothetical protein
MSRSPKLLLRRLELVEKTRQPAPPHYAAEPKNREQRRQAAGVLKRLKRNRPKNGGDLG